jgi:hypothetical protein
MLFLFINQGCKMPEIYPNRGSDYKLVFPPEISDSTANIPSMIFKIVENTPTLDVLQFIKDQQGETGTLTNISQNINTSAGVGGQAKGKEIVKGIIQLPITNSVVDGVAVDWHMEDMLVTQTLADLTKNITQPLNSANTGVSALKEAAMSMSSGYFSDTLRKTVHRIANPRKQAMFYGVQARQFAFDYIFTAKNEKEAETIQKILVMFRKYSLPSTEHNNLLFKFPHEFKIEFQGVKGFPKIDNCVCIGIMTNYTPTTLQLLKSGHAVQITMGLTFLETSLTTQQAPGIE